MAEITSLTRVALSRRALLRVAGGALAIPIAGSLLAACGASEGPDDGDDDEPTATAAESGGAEATSGEAQGTSAEAGSTEAEEAEATPETSTGDRQQGGSLTVGLDQEPPTMDPHASPSAITFYITASTGESLLYLSPERELQPWVAASYEVSDDGTAVTFTLNEGVTFQDETPLNAEAVQWNFDRIVDPNYEAGGALAALGPYDGCEVVDDLNITVNFSEPFAPFLINAAGGTLALLSPEGTEGQGDEVNNTPIMSGPYQITEWVQRSHITIQRWDGYSRRLPWADHDGPGFLDEVTWQFIPEAGTRVTTIESGETQIATVIPAQDLPRLESSDDIEVVKQPWVGAPRIWLLTMSRPPTDDLNVRQAINYAVDKDAIVNTVYNGIGTKAVAPLTLAMLDDPSFADYYPFDQDMAKQLLEEAGWVEGSDGIREKDGEPLHLVLNAIDYGGGPEQTVILIQGQLREVGIDVEIKAQARPPWYEDNYNCATNGPVMFLRSGDYDGLFSLFHSSNVGGNFNWSCVEDPELDAMLEEGRQEMDPEARRELYVTIQQKLLEMAASVPLVDELSVWAVRSDFSGLQFNGFTYPVITEMSAVDE